MAAFPINIYGRTIGLPYRALMPEYIGPHRWRSEWEPPTALADPIVYRRLLRDTTPVQRGLIRNLVLVIDLSSAMSEKDFRPTRYIRTLRLAIDFVQKYFEQNPISQLSILGMRDGLAVKLSDLSGNIASHVAALQKKLDEVATSNPQAAAGSIKSLTDAGGPKGSPSLQNVLDMSRAYLTSVPSHGTREVLIIFGAIMTADPGDIHATINTLVTDRIRVRVIGLAARIAICSELVSRTNNIATLGSSQASSTADTLYGVALDEKHLQDLLMIHTTPPATSTAEQEANPPKLLPMGFPSRADEDHESLCACHLQASRGGYFCTRCSAKVCSLPAACPTCGLQLVQSTHLARSFHHLFPLRNFETVPWAGAGASVECAMCMVPFPEVPEGFLSEVEGGWAGNKMDTGKGGGNLDGSNEASGVGKKETSAASKNGTVKPVNSTTAASESSRYRCTNCGSHYCVDCDVYMHEVLHNCEGCLC